jgi:hypothetical protein
MMVVEKLRVDETTATPLSLRQEFARMSEMTEFYLAPLEYPLPHAYVISISGNMELTGTPSVSVRRSATVSPLTLIGENRPHPRDELQAIVQSLRSGIFPAPSRKVLDLAETALRSLRDRRTEDAEEWAQRLASDLARSSR